MWRAILIDDEAPARSHLRELLQAHPEVEIVGEAANVAQAAEACHALHPTLLFLDLQMPKGSGFELLSRISHVPEIIFVTAYEQYAVRAFEVNAIDYLLKPVFEDRLALALSRLGRRVSDAEHPPEAVREEDRVFLRTSKGLRVVLVRQITHIVADGNYSTVWLLDGEALLIDRTMGVWEGMLAHTKFVRLDRSFILNLEHLEEMKVSSRDSAHLTIHGRPELVKIRRAARSRLQSLLRRG
ncbi:MAG TPA: LytTR family DNA-binding domain-containing protein [Chthoniobacterales bacterium]